MADVVDAGPAAARARDEVRTFEAAGQHVAVAHVDGQWYAFADSCTHHDCPLANGHLDGTTIECDCHGSMFDIATGAIVRGPAKVPVRTYRVHVAADRLLVEVSSQANA